MKNKTIPRELWIYMDNRTKQTEAWYYKLSEQDINHAGKKLAYHVVEKWAFDEILKHSEQWKKQYIDEWAKNKQLEKTITFCVGLISTMDQYSDKHPEEVLDWIYELGKET